MRRLLPLLLATLAPPAGAQNVSFYHLPSGDTASVILTGDTGSVQVRVYTLCQGLSSYTIRVYFDSDRLTVEAADPVPGYGFAAPTVTSGTEYVDISATGSSTSCTVYVASLRFRLDSTAVQGSLLSARPTALLDNAGASLILPNTETLLGQICQAEKVWGDTDGSRRVTSRDALALLTAAVGLATTGFDLSSGDIDADGEITTRDALYALSAAVGLWADRAGRPVVNRCAPLAPAPADAAFFANSQVWRIAAGDTIPQLVGFSPYQATRPTWAPDGSRILFEQFVSGWGSDFLSVSPDGSTVDTLFVSSAYDYAPSWSPDGLRIAFTSSRLSPRPLLTMNPDGTGQDTVTTPADSVWVYETAWTPDGSEILFTGYHTGSLCCTRRLYAIAPDGTGLREVFTNSAAFAPYDPAVSPAGDSVAFRGSSGDMYVAALTGDTTAVRVARLNGNADWPQWVTAGRAFRGTLGYPYGFYLERPDGRILRWARGDAYSYQYLRLRTP